MDDNSMRKSFSDEQLGEVSGGLFDKRQLQRVGQGHCQRALLVQPKHIPKPPLQMK
jgi:hypothetical protein